MSSEPQSVLASEVRCLLRLLNDLHDRAARVVALGDKDLVAVEEQGGRAVDRFAPPPAPI